MKRKAFSISVMLLLFAVVGCGLQELGFATRRSPAPNRVETGVAATETAWWEQTAVAATVVTKASRATSTPSPSKTIEPVQARLPPSPTGRILYSTPSIPNGYEFFSDKELQVSYVRPSGWDVERGEQTSGDTTLRFVKYSLKSKDNIRVILVISMPVFSATPLSSEELGHAARETFTADEVKIVEEISAMVDGQRATGIAFKNSLKGMQFFGILLSTSFSKLHYFLAWESFAEGENEMRDIYRSMLPSFKFAGE